MPTAEPVEFPILKNLRSLLLGECDMSGNFQLLVQFLKKSPDLEKLTVRRCKVFHLSLNHWYSCSIWIANCSLQDPLWYQQFSKGYSQCVNLVDLQCVKLKSTKIMYEDGDNSHELVNLLLDISGNLPNNTITLPKWEVVTQDGANSCELASIFQVSFELACPLPAVI